jgi:uncharacterized protein YjbI with pentapeptide repeats
VSGSAPEPRDLVGVHLKQKDLAGEDLRGADLTRARLERVSLAGADLRGARLCGATLIQVDLNGARLDGADLRGATLEQVELDRATLHEVDARGLNIRKGSAAGLEASGADLTGATITKLSLVDASLHHPKLDGATLDDVGISGGSIQGGSLVGLRAVGCALRDCKLRGVDLSAANIEETELRNTRIDESTLMGLLLHQVRLVDVESLDSGWQNAQLRGCRGLERGLEQALVEAGARVVRPPLVRAYRAVLASRPLQIALVVGLVLLVLGVLWLINSPGLWPSPLLMSRLERLESRSDLERCEPLIELGEVLTERRGVDGGRRRRLLQRMAECHLLLGAADEAEGLMRRYVASSQSDPEELPVALVALGRFLIERDDHEGAREVADQLRALGEEPAQRLVTLRFEAEILTGQGLSAIPAAPAEDRPDDPWRSLHLSIAQALLELPDLSAHHLEGTPTELFVVGQWEQAVAVLDAVTEPPLDAWARWRPADEARERIVEAGEPALALALLGWLHERHGLRDVPDFERLAAMVALHWKLGAPEDARALLEGIPTPDDPRLALELALVRARLLVTLGEPAQAQALLEGAPPPPEAGYDGLSRHAWLLAEARLEAGDEPGALQALEPALASVPEKEQAQVLLRELAAWAERLAEPQGITALLERVDNPMLDKAGQGQELALTTLRARAREGAIPPDDPALLAVLERGTPEQLQEAASLLLQGARRDGSLEEAVDALLPHARKLADTRSRETLGLMLAEAAAAAALYGQVERILAELDLLESGDKGVRSRAVGVRVDLALRQGDLDRALSDYRAAVGKAGELEDWVRRDLGRRLVDALLSAGHGAEALALARELRDLDRDDPELWRKAMTCLLILGDTQAFEEERAAATDALGACGAHTVATRAQLDRGREPTGLVQLEEACSARATSAEARLAAADVLGQADRPRAALALARGAAAAKQAGDPGVRAELAVARWQHVTGDREGAMATLESAYRASRDPGQQRQITEALVARLGSNGEPEPLLEAYLRFAQDHPDAVELPLWKQAALELIRMGQGELLPRLEGPPGWERHVAREAGWAELDALVQAGAHEDAWAWLDEALASASDETLSDLLLRASNLADRSNGAERLLLWLDALEARATPESTSWSRARLRRARTLESLGRSAEAAELLGSLLGAGLEPALRAEALEGYGRSLGRAHDTAAIELALATLESLEIAPARRVSLRLRAAEQLLDRGEPGMALELLEPLAGETIDDALAEPCWRVLVRALVARERAAEALTVPERYPSSASPCSAALILVQHLPGASESAATARERALEVCAPAELPLPQALTLAQALTTHQPQRALELLDDVNDATELGAEQRAQLDIQRAQLLRTLDRTAEARALLESLLEGADQPGLAARASAQLVRMAAEEGGSQATERIEAIAGQGLDHTNGDLPATRQVLLATVSALRGLEAWEQAVTWQQRLVQSHADDPEGESYALLELLSIQLDASPGGPAEADPSWLEHLARGQAIATPNGHVHTQLLALDLAWAVVQAGEDRAGIDALLDEALTDVNDGSSLLNKVATQLDGWREVDAAKAVREVRGARYP